jgi:hypothetical protein
MRAMNARLLGPFAPLPLVVALAACSSSSSSNDSGVDASTTMPDAAAVDAAGDDSTTDSAMPDASTVDVFQPGPHEPFLQVPNQGGPRLQHPALVTITFAGDTRHTDFEQYAQWLVGSSWLTTVGGEYGIGAGTVGGAVQVTDSAPTTPITSADVETYLATGIENGTIPTPAGGFANALFLIYYPTTADITTTFAGGVTAQSCTDWGAYHGEAHQMGLDFSYAVMADCNSTGPMLTDEQEIEIAASHEIIEAATDAFPITQPAYQLAVDPTSAWYSFFQFEVEVGDLCEIPALAATETGHVAQRIWSNAAAAAGHDPCIPTDPTIPYFNTSASPNMTAHAAPGATVQFQLQGWSVAPVADWTLSTALLGTFTPMVQFSTMNMNNGGTSTMSVTVPADAAAGTSARIVLWSEHSASDYHSWELDVATP